MQWIIRPNNITQPTPRNYGTQGARYVNIAVNATFSF